MRTLAVPEEWLRVLLEETESAVHTLPLNGAHCQLLTITCKHVRALLAAPGVEGLTPSDFTAAHLEGRIRTYLQILKGEWPYRVDLTECIEEDLRRLKESRTPAPEER